MFVVMFPRDALRIDSRDLTTVAARRIKGDHGVGALVSPFLFNLRRNAADGTLPTTPMLENAVLDLLCAALDDAAPHDAPGSTLLIEAKSLVESQLSDPTLSTASLAAHLHISTRYLQKLFALDGRTVAGWIRSRRLERCHRDLRDPRFAADSIGTVCARHGLIDSSNFSKLFKETYGMSPREYRAG
jgi:AraC-like DNA-binding protein